MKLCKALIYAVLPVLLLLAACGAEAASPNGKPDDKGPFAEEKKEEPKKTETNKPEDLPGGDNAFLLQSVDSVGSKVYVSGLSGKGGGYDVFTESSAQVFTFKLCPDDDGGFVGWFWEPAAEGLSSRTQYYGDTSFLSGYYQTAVEREAFHPTACSYEFNEDGELSELFELADLSYHHPEEPSDSEPEEILELRDGSEIELFAEDAVLNDAPDVILEPDFPPYNLGGWLDDNVVAWEFDVPDGYEGDYAICIYYSRPYLEHDIEGTLGLYSLDDPESIQFVFSPEATSEEEHDWSVYEVSGAGAASLYKGSYRLEIRPGTPDDWNIYSDHFINLRSVILVPGYEAEEPEEPEDAQTVGEEEAMDILMNAIDMAEGTAIVSYGEEIIDGVPCHTFAYGINTPEKFTAEVHYAVTGEGRVLIYDFVDDEYREL